MEYFYPLILLITIKGQSDFQLQKIIALIENHRNLNLLQRK